MSELKFKPKLPEIADSEQTPLVQDLLRIIASQQERIAQLEEEIRRLKGGPGRPRLRPSRLESERGGEAEAEQAKQKEGKRRGGHAQRRKSEELEIHERRNVKAQGVPEGSRFKGYRRYVVQDLEVRAHNSCFWLEQWQTPTGEYVSAEVPLAVHGGHFGPTLVSFVLHQYHHNHVTQPLLLEQLGEFGVQISAGQLNRLLVEDQERFHQEKAEVKTAGLEVSSYVQTDDTTARHQGRNGYCTYLGNERFAWFESTASKSRINFLECLQPRRRYVIDAEVLEYLAERGLAQCHCQVLAARGAVDLSDEKSWHEHLHACAVEGERAVALATEGALLGGLLAQGISAKLGIVSDGAKQFQILVHALCWVHTERSFTQLLALNELDRRAIEWTNARLRQLYGELKAYQARPTPEQKAAIEAAFEALCATETVCTPLNAALVRLHQDKADLLRVLERPELPLHNNRSESDLREYVKKRKISGSTRSDEGRRCRDTFASLKKTCRKQKLSFWAYLKDRIGGSGLIPRLADLIYQGASP